MRNIKVRIIKKYTLGYDIKSIQFLMLCIFSVFVMINCSNVENKPVSNNNNQNIIMAKKIKIDSLKNELTKLQNHQTEFDFIGITSNGIDCIYFVSNKENFDIEFEAVTVAQIPFIEKLKTYANENNYKNTITTYNNKPEYQSDKPAPVLHIETNLTINQVTEIARKIQSEVFKNNNETIYEVVP